MNTSYHLSLTAILIGLFGLGTFASQVALAQSNCTAPYLGENGPEICVTITPSSTGIPVVLRSPAGMAAPAYPVVGTFGEYDVNVVVTYASGGTGSSIDVAGTITRSSVGTESITIDAEGGWGTPSPAGAGDVVVNGFATGAALVQQGSAVGHPAGVVPAQDVVYTGFPPTCFEPIYGPRPPGNPGVFDCRRVGNPVEAGAVAVRSITVVSINEVGDLVDLPAGTIVGNPPLRPSGDTPAGPIQGSAELTCGADSCEVEVNGHVTSPNPLVVFKAMIPGISGFTCTGPGATPFGDGSSLNPFGCSMAGETGLNNSGSFTVSCPVDPVPGSISFSTEPGGETANIPIMCINENAPGSISGFKFEDLNANGRRDTIGFEDGVEIKEPLIPWWGINVNGSPYITTDAQGYYLLAGFLPGYYEISEMMLEGWYPSTQTEGIVVVQPGKETPDIYFGNYRLGHISGRKWQDDNGNGVIDPGEPFLEDWTITCNDGPSCVSGFETKTDADGMYYLSNIVPGDYTIGEVQMPGYEMTYPVLGGGSHHVSVQSAQHVQDVDFGNRLPPPPPDDADWGDAPESVDPALADIFPVGYPTTVANAGAYHPLNTAIRLGGLVDPELDGQPTIPADGDDEMTSDDEDGVEFANDFVLLKRKLNPPSDEETLVPGLIQGEEGKIVVHPSQNGFLDGWVDWNRDGDWDDEGEKVYGEMVTATVDTLEWSTPETADPGYTYARFRFTAAGTEQPGGAGAEGEVEDYILYTLEPTDLTSSDDTEDVNPGDGICADASGKCTVRAAIMESNASGEPFLVDAGSLAKNERAVLQPQTPYPAITGSLLLNGAGTLEIDGSQAGAGAHGFVLQGSSSYIAATTIHGFDSDGIRIEGSDNFVFENQITNNGGNGISVASGSANTLRMNAISGNGGLGIDLNADGVTQNDVGDADAGPNGLQNAPAIGVVTAENGRVEGNISSLPDTEYTIDLFVSPTCDASGYGEAASYIGSIIVTTDGLGSAGFNKSVAQGAIQIGEAVTATATGPDGTSELSSCFYAVTTDVEESSGTELPEEYRLFQNYPNPFNPTTTIRFALSHREWVTLEIYSLLGRKVVTLVDRMVEAGEFTVEFDGQALPSGVYLYRMTAGSFTRTMQLTLLK